MDIWTYYLRKQSRFNAEKEISTSIHILILILILI